MFKMHPLDQAAQKVLVKTKWCGERTLLRDLNPCEATKKRKSGEMSTGDSPGKQNNGKSLGKAKREARADSEGFVDIDDIVNQSPTHAC